METRRKDSESEVIFFNDKSCLYPDSHFCLEIIKRNLEGCNGIFHGEYRDEIFRRKSIKNVHDVRQLTKELEKIINSINPTELRPYLQSCLADASLFTQLIFQHVITATSEHPASRQILNYTDTFYNTWYRDLKSYYDMYYKDIINPEVSFDLIHNVWKYHPDIEFKLMLLCCHNLIQTEHYDKVDQLIRYNKDYFLSSSNEYVGSIFISQDFDIYPTVDATHITVLLILLFHCVKLRQWAKVKTVGIFIKKRVSEIDPLFYVYLSRKSFSDFMRFSLWKKQIRLMPFVIKELQHVLNKPELQNLNLKIISLCFARLMEVNCQKEAMEFIKDNSHFLINLALSLNEQECDVRQKHSILLLMLLHAYVMCEDLTNMSKQVMNRLQELRQLLFLHGNESCYCFMGTIACKKLFVRHNKDASYCSGLVNIDPILATRVISCLVWELEAMLEGSDEKYSHEQFINLIEQISVHTETGLDYIIKTLCDLEMQPEIQDMVIEGLTEYMQVKYNKQYSILSNFLLNINITCHKIEFLQKLTINVGQHLLSIEEYSGKDFEKIIYRCFCIVRHENKVNDNATNIENFKKNFSFITTMEAEAEMEKLSHLRSFLVMLIFLSISSGGPHISEKLNKYLCLKYEYEDAILYLLWCSGDVEINPGPTLKKLRPQEDSVKKRNWIHEMSAVSLKLLKNKAVNSKYDGLWKEKPESWQDLHGDKPFYDPRNKPKGKQYSIKTDEELLNCLIKCCDKMSIKFPCHLQREITAWKSDIVLLLQLYVSRKEIDAVKMAKDLMMMYVDTQEFKQYMKDYDFGITFNPNSTHGERSKGYSDVVRDFAITLCRITKGLPIFEKSDGIWIGPPHDWNPKHLYYSPCNTAKRLEKNQDQLLVDNLLFYCESKSKSIPSELQLVVKAWKLKDIHEICKHYTIWSCMATIQHSIKYLEIEGLLEKAHVQESLRGISINTKVQKKVFSTDCQTRLSEISSQQTDYQNQPSTSRCCIDRKMVQRQEFKYDFSAKTERVKKRKRTISEERSDKRSALQSGDENQPSTSQITRSNGYTTPSSHCDSDSSTDQNVNSTVSTEEEVDQDLSSNRIPVPDNQASTSSITICNSDTTLSSHCGLDNADQNVNSTVNTEEEVDQDLSSNRIPVPNNIQDTDSSYDQLPRSEDEMPTHLLRYLSYYMNHEEEHEEEIEHIERQLRLYETL